MTTARWVYLIYSGDECLYVGQSGDLPARIRQHTRTQPWWPTVTEVRAMVEPNSASASELETRLIRELRPAHNKQANPDVDPPRGPRRITHLLDARDSALATIEAAYEAMA